MTAILRSTGERGACWFDGTRWFFRSFDGRGIDREVRRCEFCIVGEA